MCSGDTWRVFVWSIMALPFPGRTGGSAGRFSIGSTHPGFRYGPNILTAHLHGPTSFRSWDARRSYNPWNAYLRDTTFSRVVIANLLVALLRLEYEVNKRSPNHIRAPGSTQKHKPPRRNHPCPEPPAPRDVNRYRYVKRYERHYTLPNLSFRVSCTPYARTRATEPS